MQCVFLYPISPCYLRMVVVTWESTWDSTHHLDSAYLTSRTLHPKEAFWDNMVVFHNASTVVPQSCCSPSCKTVISPVNYSFIAFPPGNCISSMQQQFSSWSHFITSHIIYHNMFSWCLSDLRLNPRPQRNGAAAMEATRRRGKAHNNGKASGEGEPTAQWGRAW